MSWNPSPTIGSASWQGNAPIVTQRQFLSTSAGIISQIKLSTISTFDTLTAIDWMSTPVLYVSDIRGFPQLISANTANFNLVTVSSIGFNAPDIGPLVDVKVDFNLGDFVQGALIGTGALLFETAVGIGIGAGATFIGIGNGIAALINSKDPVNNTTYINTNNYEVMGGSTQLQVSTLGNANPTYSSIMRYVSSIAPNQVAGVPMFTSTLFYPGQICIRSISDPYPLVTANPECEGSTIQQFGEWVPITGLEPTNIDAESISTINLSTQNLFASLATLDSIQNYTLITSNAGIATNLSMNYDADILFTTGTGTYARIVGTLQNLYLQTDDRFIFTQLGTSVENASLNLGLNANESLLTVSSIFSQGNIQANTGFFSTLSVNNLLVISTLSTLYQQSNITILSTAIVTADLVSTQSLQAKFVAPFTFSSVLGNPSGIFDITKYDSFFSTTYNSVSSLQQNILNYSLNLQNQNEATLNIGDNPGIGLTYEVTPANIGQWASTQLIFNGYQGPGGIDLGWVGQWGVTPGDTTGVAPGGATFDVLYEPNPNGANAPFYLTEQSNKAYPVGLSTFFQQTNPNPPSPITFTARMTLPPVIGGSRSGWWQMTTPAPAPYATSNNNTFQIYQDINDTYIQGTDRLHLVAGDILLDGTTIFQNIQVQNLDLTTLTACNAFLYSTFADQVNVSSFASQTYSNIFSFTGSANTPGPTQPFNFQYNLNSTDFTNIRTLTVPSRGPNMFNSMNVNEWNNTQYNPPTGTNATSGGPQIYLGELTRTSGFAYGPARFWINNTTTPPIPFPVYVVKPGSWLSTLGAATTAGTGYTLIQTPDGVNWSLTSNVANPQGGTYAPYLYSNYYNLQMNDSLTQLNVGMPFTEVVSGTKSIVANKVILNANQIRTITYASPSFPPREAGFELSAYFDANVIFDGTQSDAINNIISPYGSLGYAVVAWSPQLWFGRIRTATTGIQGFEIEAVVNLISGSFADYIWASHRYLNCTSDGEANIREIYFMVPFNFMTNEYLVGPY